MEATVSQRRAARYRRLRYDHYAAIEREEMVRIASQIERDVSDKLDLTERELREVSSMVDRMQMLVKAQFLVIVAAVVKMFDLPFIERLWAWTVQQSGLMGWQVVGGLVFALLVGAGLHLDFLEFEPVGEERTASAT